VVRDVIRHTRAIAARKMFQRNAAAIVLIGRFDITDVFGFKRVRDPRSATDACLTADARAR
jgi:hypothetical protein